MNPSMKQPRFLEVAFDAMEPVSLVVLPDSGNPKSRQWKGKRVVLTRLQLAKLYRRWRDKGGKPRQGMPLASMLIDLLVEHFANIDAEGRAQA